MVGNPTEKIRGVDEITQGECRDTRECRDINI